MRLWTEQLAHALEQKLQVCLHGLKLDAPRLQLSQVQAVVDQAQQVLGAVVQRLQIGRLGRVQRRGRKKPRHADDAIQRCAQLVAQQGEDPLTRPRSDTGRYVLRQGG